MHFLFDHHFLVVLGGLCEALLSIDGLNARNVDIHLKKSVEKVFIILFWIASLFPCITVHCCAHNSFYFYFFLYISIIQQSQGDASPVCAQALLLQLFEELLFQIVFFYGLHC